MIIEIIDITDEHIISKCLSTTKPEIGVKYSLEDATNGTYRQIKAIRGLNRIYFYSNHYPYRVSTETDLYKQLKAHLGLGFETIIWFDDDYKKHFARDKSEIPPHILSDPDRVHGFPKSLSKYTRNQRSDFLEAIKIEMMTVFMDAGYHNELFTKILQAWDEYKVYGEI